MPPRGGDDSNLEPESLRKVFIGGLNYNTTDDGLREYFEQWGKLVDVVVMKDPKTRKSRGFGFVTYENSEQVDKAQAARPHKIDGRTVDTKRAVPREDVERPESNATVKKVFVGGIKEDIEEDEIRTYFEDFGTVTDVAIVTERGSGKRRGFGFVTFDDYDAVDKVVLKKGSLFLGGKRLDVKKALSKEEMAEIEARKERRGDGPGRGRGGGDRKGWGGRGGDPWGQEGGYGGGFGSYNQGGGGGGPMKGGYGGDRGGPYSRDYGDRSGYGASGGGGSYGGAPQGAYGGGNESVYGAGYSNNGASSGYSAGSGWGPNTAATAGGASQGYSAGGFSSADYGASSGGYSAGNAGGQRYPY